MTYGTVRVFADERVLERYIRRKVRRRGPHRVVSRIKRYLRLSAHQNRVLVLPTYRVGRVPVSERRHAAHDENVLEPKSVI